MYYAHTKDDPQTGERRPVEEWQTLLDHLTGVAESAKEFADAFGSGRQAYVLGLLHDIGKYSQKFQLRLREGGHYTDHSTAGAVEAERLLRSPYGRLFAYCLAGHHGGLPDGGSGADTGNDATLYARLQKTEKIEPYDAYAGEIGVPDTAAAAALMVRPLGERGFTIAFYLRMLFSCLVDADYLDTERVMQGNVDRKLGDDIEALQPRLDAALKKYLHPTTEFNQRRCDILQCCLDKARLAPGLFSLTVPTGGGKTVSSLAFALTHAKQNKMRRVIYVIPYYSIIEQNAGGFKEMLGVENVLEHHSGFAYDDSDESAVNEKKKLAAENWDMPVIVTTTVQFFESLFANKPSQCRKLHNIAGSVIIFDEAQMLPRGYLLPCVRAISELVVNYGCSAVLCSATQPALDPFFPKPLRVTELCENVPELFRFFRRTLIQYVGELTDGELASRLNAAPQALCIVNTRAQARALFERLKGDGVFHLSTFMYPTHRKAVLQTIRDRLKAGLPCRVVSTSLVEAGVDLDFPVVYRGEAGLDSQIQAAGRCNREGKLPLAAPVYIFTAEARYRSHMPSVMRRPIECAKALEGRYDDPASPEAVRAYFNRLFSYEGEGLDSKHIVEAFEDGIAEDMSFPFATVAGQFHLIDNPTHAVFIPDGDEARALYERLERGEHNRDLLRAAQQFTVNVYDRDYTALCGAGIARQLDEELAVLIDMERYSTETGLAAKVESGVGIFVSV